MAHMPAAERRRQIVEAAVAVLQESGMEGASIRRIAQRAGAPLASVHYTSPDKEQLFAAVYQHWIESMAELLDGLVPAGCGLESASRLVLTGFLDRVAENHTLGIAQYELVLWAARNPSATGLATSIYDRFQEVCTDALRRATDGEVDDASLAERAELLICGLDGIMLRFLVDRDLEAARANLERFIGVVAQDRR